MDLRNSPQRPDRCRASLAREAGLGSISRSSVSAICRELRDRYRAFRARSLADVRLLSLMLDAIYLPVRPDGHPGRDRSSVAWRRSQVSGSTMRRICRRLRARGG